MSKIIQNSDRASLSRPDVDLAVISHWSVRAPEFQSGAAERLLDFRSSRPWPDGLKARYAYTGTDGVTLMTYSQWATGSVFDQSFAWEGADRDLEIGAHDITRRATDSFRLYRSLAGSETGQPGCIVLVTFDVDGAGRQTQLIDMLLERGGSEADGAGPRSQIGTHFHTNLSGTSVVNYAEFVDEHSHDAFLKSALLAKMLGFMTQMDGVTPKGFLRFIPVGGVIAKDA